MHSHLLGSVHRAIFPEQFTVGAVGTAMLLVVSMPGTYSAITLRCQGDLTIGHLKTVVAQELGVRPCQLLLKHYTAPRTRDGYTLANYGIHGDPSCLSLFVPIFVP